MRGIQATSPGVPSAALRLWVRRTARVETRCLGAAGVSASALGVEAQPAWLHRECGGGACHLLDLSSAAPLGVSAPRMKESLDLNAVDEGMLGMDGMDMPAMLMLMLGIDGMFICIQ